METEEWPYEKVKETFVEYFQNKSHTFIPSSSVVPTNDKSLLFTNSGMVQFKNIFLEKEQPFCNRACNTQKCIRAGGKHNDLDDVGKDSYHHTFFEMAGNWSFHFNESSQTQYNSNDKPYFKSEAINMAWDLLTNVYKIDASRLYVTYFKGNEEFGVPEDVETKDLWLQFVPKERIIPFGMKENFWEMGSSGPCGPCTEIHYDRIGDRDVANLVNMDDPDVIEIWNIVFMQCCRNEDGSISNLSKKNVDTGAGVERLVSVLQNCTNYEIDIFKSIIKIIFNIASEDSKNSTPMYENKYGKDDPLYLNTAYRVIADHCRTMIFAIMDGVEPSATENGYVVRRLIRRAIRYGTKLGLNVGSLSKIVGEVCDLLSPQYSELQDCLKIMKLKAIVLAEETKFGVVMKRGLKLFEKLLKSSHKVEGEKIIISMQKLGDLYTSFGFPIDIIKQMCEENNVEFSNEEMQNYMKECVEKSKLRKL